MNPAAEPIPPSSHGPHVPWRVDVASLSDVGNVRRNNEDTALALELTGEDTGFDIDQPLAGRSSAPVLLAVCDGMGGAAAGEVASREAARAIGRRIRKHMLDDEAAPSMSEAMVDAVRGASKEVFDLATLEPSYRGMGTTATVCALSRDELVIGQVGDSRAYLLRGGRMRQITRDQTLAQLLMERGQLAPEELENFYGAHVILQAVGTTDSVDVDLKSQAVERGDVLMLCSDGLVEALDDEVLEEVLIGARDAAQACERLVRLAKEAGATDNVTCVVARIERCTPPSPPEPPEPVPELVAAEPTPLPIFEETVEADDLPDTAREAGLLERIARLWKGLVVD